MRILNKLILAGSIVSCFLTIFLATDAMSVTSAVSPEHINVDSFYHGGRIEVKGEAAADEEIIIKFSSPAKKVELRKKGKKGGLLWMNVGELEFGPVSDVSLLFSTQDVNSLLSSEEQDKYLLGFDSFKRRVEVSPVSSEEEKEKWVNEFIRFKEKNKVYGWFTGKIETKTENGKKSYALTMDWPYQASPQQYTVSVYAVKDNAVQDHAESVFTVETTGALKYLSNMAFNRASFYGIVSILIAIAAGFIVSVMFKGGGGSH